MLNRTHFNYPLATLSPSPNPPKGLTPVQFSGWDRGSHRPEVLIIGGGIGGVALAKALDKNHKHFESEGITLITPHFDYIFKPNVFGWFFGLEAYAPVNNVGKWRNVNIPHNAWAERIYPETPIKQGTVKIRQDSSTKEVEWQNRTYDYLVLATGSSTDYTTVPGSSKENVIQMQAIDNIRDAWAQMILSLNEMARLFKNARKEGHILPQQEIDKLRTFRIIGGGATGIECAFELQAMLNDLIETRYPELREKRLTNLEPQIVVYEANKELLPGFSDKERALVEDRLKKRHIEVVRQTRATHFDPNTLTLTLTKYDDDKNPIGTKTLQTSPLNKPIITTRGKANFPDEILGGIERISNGQLKVKPNLELTSYPNIFAIGDIAATFDPTTHELIPPSGQLASKQAAYLAELLTEKAKTKSKAKGDKLQGKPFVYKPMGHILYLGPNDSLISVKFLPGVIITGRLASWLREFYYSALFQAPKHKK
jgi:NADH dehydrogenase